MNFVDRSGYWYEDGDSRGRYLYPLGQNAKIAITAVPVTEYYLAEVGDVRRTTPSGESDLVWREVYRGPSEAEADDCGRGLPKEIFRVRDQWTLPEGEYSVRPTPEGWFKITGEPSDPKDCFLLYRVPYGFEGEQRVLLEETTGSILVSFNSSGSLGDPGTEIVAVLKTGQQLVCEVVLDSGKTLRIVALWDGRELLETTTVVR